MYKIRRHSLDELAKKPDQSIEEIMKVIAGKKDLEELAKTTFKLEEGY